MQCFPAAVLKYPLVESIVLKTARNLVNFDTMITRLLFCLALFFSGWGTPLFSQASADSLQSGVNADSRLKTLVEKDVQINENGKEKGYRVQIYFGTDKAKANDVKTKFLSTYSTDAHAYELYDVPNFKVYAGDFRTRLEAYAFLKKIRDDFPAAFIVESDIENPVGQ